MCWLCACWRSLWGWSNGAGWGKSVVFLISSRWEVFEMIVLQWGVVRVHNL